MIFQCSVCGKYLDEESKCENCPRLLCDKCRVSHDCVKLNQALHAKGYHATVKRADE